jgi:hypothetical protein
VNPGPEDIAALREDGDLERYLRSLTVVTTPEPAPVEAEAPPDFEYRVAHRGGWPIGSASSGPTPMHDRCTCPKCSQPAA